MVEPSEVRSKVMTLRVTEDDFQFLKSLNNGDASGLLYRLLKDYRTYLANVHEKETLK